MNTQTMSRAALLDIAVTKTTERVLRRLAEALHPAGVHFVIVPTDELMKRFGEDNDDLHPCPFSAALTISWSTRTLWIEEDFFDYASPESWCAVLHELGHIMASKEHPGACNEYDFFGWEASIATRLGLLKEWLKGNADYSVTWKKGELPISVSLGELIEQDQHQVVGDRVARAQELGLVQDGRSVIRNPLTQEVVGLF